MFWWTREGDDWNDINNGTLSMSVDSICPHQYYCQPFTVIGIGPKLNIPVNYQESHIFTQTTVYSISVMNDDDNLTVICEAPGDIQFNIVTSNRSELSQPLKKVSKANTSSCSRLIFSWASEDMSLRKSANGAIIQCSTYVDAFGYYNKWKTTSVNVLCKYI